MKLQLSLLLMLINDAFILFAALDEEITVDVLNPALASSMNGEIKMMPAPLKVKYIGILGKLAFYARLYRLWISQPTTAYVGFINHFPKIRFSENILRACNRGFKICVDNIWDSIQERNSFLFSDINARFKINRDEVRRFINNEMFDFDFSAIYVFCWMTTNRVTLLEHLPFCNGKETSNSLTEIDVDNPQFNIMGNSVPRVTYWPSKLLSEKLKLSNDEEFVAIGMLDPTPYRCAAKSFCVNGCNEDISPCPKNSSCYFRARFNEDIIGMLDDNWNASCSCPESGYVYRFDVNQCVDINECMYEDCEENEICINTKGSFRCICQMGFIPIANVCTHVQLQPVSWSGPAVSAGSYCMPIACFIAFMLYILIAAHDFCVLSI